MPIIFKHAPHFKRYREIATTLARHGLGWLALQLNLGRLIPFHWGLLGHPKRKEPYTQAEHLRMALEELGTTFVKLGQILSTRPDLVPPEYVTEFSKLQDSAPPISYDEAAGVIMGELGEAPSKLFKSFDEKPRAAASIGQVHSALLKDGTPVVVKISGPVSRRSWIRIWKSLPSLPNWLKSRRNWDLTMTLSAGPRSLHSL